MKINILSSYVQPPDGIVNLRKDAHIFVDFELSMEISIHQLSWCTIMYTKTSALT